ncbi:MAG: pyrroline-5-carboxylate reductase [Burkholderiales bacterium]
MNIAFLGGGNMANALIGGLCARGFGVADMSVIEPVAAAREKLAATYHVHVSAAPDEATRSADTVVLAVKPQDMKAAVSVLAPIVSGRLVISIAAGVRIATLSRWLGGHAALVRCMPNMPALIGAGITGLYAPQGVGAAERGRAEQVLGAVGECVWVESEAQLDPVTAVSGSGPAYVFWFIEQLAQSGVSLGLAPEAARKLALHTVLGAAKLAAGSADPPGVLRERVTSKGGTTEAALKVIAAEKLGEGLARALEAASRRGAELGDLLDRD